MPVEKQNYQLIMEKQIVGIPAGTPLLMHACCAPCASAVVERLMSHFSLSLFYYNPNIAPQAEYAKRLAALQTLVQHVPGVNLLEGDYNTSAFLAAATGLETQPEGGTRCTECFRLRLFETARKAKENGIPWISTTLTISPHKNAAFINQIGLQAAEEYGINWLCADFKKKDGYRRSIQLSAEYELYRQTYCGCGYSMNS